MLRGIILGIYTVLISCSSVVLSFVLFNYLLSLNYIFLAVCFFVAIIVAITTYPFCMLYEKIQRNIQENSMHKKDGAFYGKF